MKMELEVCSELRAIHSLVGNETPHVHIWKVSVCFSSPYPLKTDRVLDLVMLQKNLELILSQHQNQNLNLTLKKSPTSEMLAVLIWEEMSKLHSEAPIKHVKVSLCNLEGDCMGIATLTL